MQTYSFVDITGDDAIQRILDDPNNFYVQAIQAETILEWIPDLGQYAAKASARARNGLFRTAGLANSGIPAVIRHRFAKPAESSRAVGTHFIGLLIFDSAQDDYTFELSCGSEEFGAIRPWRHDNRRHLVILTKPATILEAFYSFSIRAVGKGPCYLESMVFLKELPAGESTFLPVIERLSSTMIGADPTGARVQVDFITREAAAIQIVAQDEGQQKLLYETTAYETLHSCQLDHLANDQDYQLAIRAREVGGSVDEKTVGITTVSPPLNAQAVPAVPLEICGQGESNPVKLPLTFGLPFKRGAVFGERHWQLAGGGQSEPVQSRVLSRWEDGSARWILFDARCPEIQGSGQIVRAQMESIQAAVSAPLGVKWKDEGQSVLVEGERVRVSVTAGSQSGIKMEQKLVGGTWGQVFFQDHALLEGHLAGGHFLRGDHLENLSLEETGPERAVIRFDVPVRDEHATEHIRATIRFQIYARQAFIRISVRIVVTSPLLGQAFRSHDLNHLTPELGYARAAVDGDTGESTAFLKLADLEMRIPWAGLPPGQRVHQLHDRAYLVQQYGKNHQVDGRWSGPMVFEHEDRCFTVGLRDFWQNYPKALRHVRDELGIEFFPRIETDEWPDYQDEWWRLYFWLDSERKHYRLKAGMAFTTEMLFGMPEDAEEAHRWQEWLNTPPAVRPEIEYLNETGALLEIAPKKSSPHSQYEAMVDRAYLEWLRCRDEAHEYGFVNFGDYYNPRETFWGNNEYDAAFSHLMEFLRGGHPGWTVLAAQATRHLVDIDTCNFSRNPDDAGRQYIHTQGHIGGYLPPQYRNKMGESESIPSHSWVEGAVLQYLLTGDESIRETITTTGMHFMEDLQHYDFTNSRESGWQIIHLCAMARMSPAPQYVNAAAIIVEKILEKQELDGGWVHNLSQAHCWCEPPRCRGEAGFMVGVLLSSLRRYYELTRDPRVAQAIINGARWLVDRTFVPEAGLFKYTSCPSRIDPKVDCTVMVIEGLADASLFTEDPVVRNALDLSLKVIGETNLSHTDLPRYGKDLLIESRYIPTMMAILSHTAPK